MHRISRLLIANRGEIALRITRAAREMGKHVLAVYAENDRNQPFVMEADEAYSLGCGGLPDTYLNGKKIIEVAKEAGADAIHPGYGFLSENPGFAGSCNENQIIFIGPDTASIALMGDKARAREKASELGLPVLQGICASPGELLEKRQEFNYPLLVKASAGGGGRGMRLVREAGDLENALEDASRESFHAFGSGELYIEQYLDHCRHIEVQVMADHHQNTIHLFDRECSLQRRHQKIIEEAPSPSLSRTSRERILKDALRLARGLEYRNAGTVEFLVDTKGNHYFLEMNTRIQVEHPATEMITGTDLVREQIRIAEGLPLQWKQEDIRINGHAIEARLYAEDPETGFLPGTGKIRHWKWPQKNLIRLDAGVGRDIEISPDYDPLVAKAIAHGKDREEARLKLLDALSTSVITGLTTNRQFLITLLKSDSFRLNKLHTSTIDNELGLFLGQMSEERAGIPVRHLLTAGMLHMWIAGKAPKSDSLSPWRTLGPWRLLPTSILVHQGKAYRLFAGRKMGKSWEISMDNETWEAGISRLEGDSCTAWIEKENIDFTAVSDGPDLWILMDGYLNRLGTGLPEKAGRRAGNRESLPGQDRITAPLNGRIVRIHASEGEVVSNGAPLVVIESMKMENQVLAPGKGKILKLHVKENEQVHKNQIIITLDKNDTSTDQ